MYAGTEPGAIFKSTDRGETFQLERGLWDNPQRKEWNAGYGGQAFHTILPHPEEPQKVLAAISTGGVYRTDDGGDSWYPSNTGVKAEFMPGERSYPEFGQCVHKVTRHPAHPDRLYPTPPTRSCALPAARRCWSPTPPTSAIYYYKRGDGGAGGELPGLQPAAARRAGGRPQPEERSPGDLRDRRPPAGPGPLPGRLLPRRAAHRPLLRRSPWPPIRAQEEARRARPVADRPLIDAGRTCPPASRCPCASGSPTRAPQAPKDGLADVQVMVFQASSSS